jgi:hypothetical protein
MKKSEELEAKYAALSKQIETVQEGLNKIVEGFRAELPTAAKSWIEENTKRKVTNTPAIAKSLGVEGVRLLKSQVAELCERLQALADAALGSRDKWPHYSTTGGPESFADAAFRELINKVGRIWSSSGLLDAEGKSPYRTWHPLNGGEFRYDGGLDIPLIKAFVVKYQPDLDRLRALQYQHAETKRATELAVAEEIWGQA